MDSFSTPRMRAERLTAEHWLDLGRMDQDEVFMAMLGGVRDEAGTALYLEQNLEHWADDGYERDIIHAGIPHQLFRVSDPATQEDS